MLSLAGYVEKFCFGRGPEAYKIGENIELKTCCGQAAYDVDM